MNRPYGIIAEMPADLMKALDFAMPLRRKGVAVLTPVSFSKPRKQIARMKGEGCWRLVVIANETATLIDVETGCRVQSTASDICAAILDLQDDWAEDFNNASAEKMATFCWEKRFA